MFLIFAQGSLLDSNNKSPFVILSNNGRTASVFQYGYGSVVGTVGYRSGVHQWRIYITELGGRPAPLICIGVTTLPILNDNYLGFSVTTAYVWLSDQDSEGLAASQTRGPARISSWQTGDTLLLTLNCDQLELHLFLQRTGERKTIYMHQSVKGVKLYLYLNFNNGVHRVDILEW